MSHTHEIDARSKTMQASQNFRRHDDGSIDFGHYRRRAARRRRFMKRIVFMYHRRRAVEVAQRGIATVQNILRAIRVAPARIQSPASRPPLS